MQNTNKATGKCVYSIGVHPSSVSFLKR